MTQQTAQAISVDPSALPHRDRYKLLAGLVIPRPIAFVTSVSPSGTVNAAPFSFFNVVSDSPPVCVFGVDPRNDGSLKDTAANIMASGVFVVNLVDEALGEKMNQCSTDFPPGVSEVEAVGLTLLPSVTVSVPRLADAPVSMECRLRDKMELGPNHYMFAGDILHLHVRSGVVDPPNLRTDLTTYRPLARLSGNHYASLGPLVTHERISYEQWKARKAAE